MGCDIHLTVERKVHEKWICVDTICCHNISSYYFKDNDNSFSSIFPVALERNYRRFAALAGVQGTGPEPRGLPDDISETTQLLINDYGGHSHSWLPAQVAARIFLDTESGKLTDYDKKYPSSYYFNIADTVLNAYRIVFWFDN